MKKRTRIRSKDIGFTYSQQNVYSRQEIFNMFENLFANRNEKITYLLVVEELHKKGEDKKHGRHNHVFLQLDKNIETDNMFFFDFPDIPHVSIHNPIRNTDNFRDYCLKNDKEFIEKGEYRFKKYVFSSAKLKEDPTETIIFDEAERLSQEFLKGKFTKELGYKMLDDFIRKTSRKYYYDKPGTIQRIKEKNFSDELFIVRNQDKEIIYSLDTFIKDKKIKEIIEHIKKEKDAERPLTLVVEGLSQIGKTKLIKSILQHFNLRFNDITAHVDMSIENFKDGMDVILLDDISLGEIISKGLHKVLIGGQRNRLIDAKQAGLKYQTNRKIKSRMLTIALVNPDESWESYLIKNQELGKTQYQYIRKNTKIIQFGEKQLNGEMIWSDKPLYLNEKEKELQKKISGNPIVELAQIFFGKDKIEIE